MNVEFQVVQLLVSRVCHDLAGGLSALRTGSDLLLEDGGAFDSATVDLIALSARQSTHRLQFLRAAFGFGGAQGGTLSSHDLAKLTRNYLDGGRISIVWSENNRRLDLAPGKLLLNLCLIASETLPRGGVIEVVITDLEDGLGFAVAARGEGARLLSDLQAAIVVDLHGVGITSRTVHGHYTAVLAAHLGAQLEIVADGGESVRFAALLPL